MARFVRGRTRDRLSRRAIERIATTPRAVPRAEVPSRARQRQSNGKFIAAEVYDELRVCDRNGQVIHVLPHHHWPTYGGTRCLFDPHDRLWYFQPRDTDDQDDLLTVVDPESAQVLATEAVANPLGYSDFYNCPNNDQMLIDIGCGQDGSYWFLAHLQGSRLTVHAFKFCDRTCPGSFAPSGREFASGAHEGDSLQVHAFPGGQTIACLDRATMFAEDARTGDRGDDVGYQAVFLDNEHILATTRIYRLVLVHRPDMRVLGTVWPEGYVIRPYDQRGHATNDPNDIFDYEGDLNAIYAAGAGRLLAAYGDGRLELLDVSPLLATH